MTKFGFVIRTRNGLTIQNLVIHGRDQADAERKLGQMYLHFEILERSVIPETGNTAAKEITAKEKVAFEDIVSLIANQDKAG
ncbi:MAG TPA: hypothetical protein VLV32_09810 [Burkholderiales bacterium]|jgi:hypothetical protein|nr:hypothetical protein [Burkholderiales bacterium]